MNQALQSLIERYRPESIQDWENALKEITYSDIKEKGNQTFDAGNGWLGITDKYWLAALVPAAKDNFKTTGSVLAPRMTKATTASGITTENIPTARPRIITVATPVKAALEMDFIGAPPV